MKKLTLKSKILIIVLICSMMAILPIAIVSITNTIKPSNFPQAAASPSDLNGDGIYDCRIDGHEQTFEIYNLLGLKKFRDNVNGGTAYSGWTITLKNDIKEVGVWMPIGNSSKNYFSGVFDGGNNKISGITKFEKPHKRAGLFGFCVNAVIKNLEVANSTIECKITGIDFIGIVVSLLQKSTISNCLVRNCVLNILEDTADDVYASAVVCDLYSGSMDNCVAVNVTLNTNIKVSTNIFNQPVNSVSLAGLINRCHVLYKSGPIKVDRCCFIGELISPDNKTEKGAIVSASKLSDYNVQIINCWQNGIYPIVYNNQNGCEITNSNSYTSGDYKTIMNTHKFYYSYGNIDKTKEYYIPASDEYNGGFPIQTVFVDYETYEVKTVENADIHAVDKGTITDGVNAISSFNVPIPKDDPSTKYTEIPDNNSPNQAFVVDVIGQNVVATPACKTCRQFSHWEVNGKTLIAHFKAKEVPANCTVKFNGHSYANTTSNISLYEFKLHPGSTIKCEVSNDKRIYTYIVVKGGDCPDCDRPLTTGEEYARITYTLKIDPGQPASKYELDSLDSSGFIKGSNTEYIITKSTTISPTFILKEYDVEIG